MFGAWNRGTQLRNGIPRFTDLVNCQYHAQYTWPGFMLGSELGQS